jgi:hypothetical protein
MDCLADRPVLDGYNERKMVSSFNGRTFFFLFKMVNGKLKYCSGRTAGEAYETLNLRLTAEEMKQIKADDFIKCKQEEYRQYIPQLG